MSLFTNERKAREFAKREQEILSAALNLFDPERWDQITVAQIATHTGIGKGTIYKHFSSKEEIYARLALEDARRIVQLFSRVLAADPQASGLAQVRTLLETSFAHHRNNPALGSIHMFCKQLSLRGRLSGESQQQLVAVEQEIMALFSQALLRGAAAGEIVKLPLPVLFTGMHATFEGALLMLRNQDYACLVNGEHALNADEFIQYVVDYMMAALSASRQSLLPELVAAVKPSAVIKG